MPYDLAKQLKDAGFNCNHILERKVHTPDIIIPTLEELIEACGEIDLQVQKKGSSCLQWGNSDEDGTPFRYDGPTPTEAVARLWLAINKK